MYIVQDDLDKFIKEREIISPNFRKLIKEAEKRRIKKKKNEKERKEK